MNLAPGDSRNLYRYKCSVHSISNPLLFHLTTYFLPQSTCLSECLCPSFIGVILPAHALIIHAMQFTFARGERERAIRLLRSKEENSTKSAAVDSLFEERVEACREKMM